MPISDYMRDLRARVGTTLVLIPTVTALVFDDAGRVLLAQHSTGGVWATPGGAIDPDEAPQDAVVREVWEETGLHVEPVRSLGSFGGPEFRVMYDNRDEVAFVIAAYECRCLGGTLRPDGDEILATCWVAAGELAGLTLAPWARVVLPRLVGERSPWVPPVGWRPPPSA